MPVVTVRVTRDGMTADRKRAVVADIPATLGREPGKRPEHTDVTTDEVDPENWGFAGLAGPHVAGDRATRVGSVIEGSP